MRLGQFYREFSEYYDVTLLTSTGFDARYEEIIHKPGFTELRFPKDLHWRRAYAALDAAGVSGDLAGLAFLLAVSDPACQLRRAALELSKNASVVIHEFPYSEPIFAESEGCVEIYNSHNVEACLLSSIVRGPGFENVFLRLLRSEGNLIRRAAKVFGTSPADAETFRLLYGAKKARIDICPNGFSSEELDAVAKTRAAAPPRSGLRPLLLFSGSGHHPNVEAADFVLRLAVDLPECDFILAGGVCKLISDRTFPENVQSYGVFTPDEKLALLSRADIYLNPVVLGSGTSLKALESIGAGVPTVATPEAVRGLGLVADKHARIVRRDEMAAAIRALLEAPKSAAEMSVRARDYALANFTWKKIAGKFVKALTANKPDTDSDPPLVLALNDYPVLLARAGGEVRIRKLLEKMQCDVVLLTFATQSQVSLLEGGILHLTVAKSPEQIALTMRINEGQSVSADDIVAAFFSGGSRALSELVATFARRASALIFEHPYMAAALDTALSVRPDLPIVYSAHNVEATHKAAMLAGHPMRTELVTFVQALERRLVDHAALVVCCSEADARHFIAQERTVMVVPNGCDIPTRPTAKRSKRSPKPRVGFLGSSHTPNAVAARYIAEKLAPEFPNVQFEFIGGACDAVASIAAENIVRHGILSEPAKSALLYEWDLALNPIEAGGGSSLKLSDFMAHGLPTLSTAVGARSFDVEAYGAGRVAPLAEFPKHLREMLGDRDRLQAMGENARRYAESELDWNVIAGEYYAELATFFAPPQQTRPRRLLVVTYRYTEPPRGGAEEYLIEVLKRLRPRFDVIDLAAVDVEHITNRHHFGCEVRPGVGASARVGDLFDHSHYFESEEPPELELIARCRELERAWSHEDFDLFRPFLGELAGADELRLLGGFFSVEVHDGVLRRWTAPRFSFLLPASAAVFRMTGWGAIDKRLKARLIDIAPDGSTRQAIQIERRISASVDLSLALPAAPSGVHRVLEVEVDEHIATGDHRPFGILLESAHALVARETAAPGALRPLGYFSANMSEDVAEKLRVARTRDWVAALRDTALSRTRSTDEHFAASRGPHAPSMQEWLAANSVNYDAVLVQGIPFDVIPSSVQTLSRLPHRPRIVTLPHFHGDDRFYYWRSYLDAFEAADCTLLFSDFLADQLGKREKFGVVPGGGVRVAEITDLGAAATFAEVHKSDKPFFLVLGRKVGSKGYEIALRAHQRLRRSRPEVELVMIGPDDDGRPVSGEGVYYLGRQPREVIRGALASCLALVTMSQSESFGIVLCEAWLFGKPVIANVNCYSFRDLVRQGETGMLVGTDEELAGAMEAMVGDPERRLRMGRAGFRDVIERYSWEGVAEAVVANL